MDYCGVCVISADDGICRCGIREEKQQLRGLFLRGQAVKRLGGGAFGAGFRYERVAVNGAAGKCVRAWDRAGMDCHRAFYRDGMQLVVYFGTAAELYHPCQQLADAAHLF